MWRENIAIITRINHRIVLKDNIVASNLNHWRLFFSGGSMFRNLKDAQAFIWTLHNNKFKTSTWNLHFLDCVSYITLSTNYMTYLIIPWRIFTLITQLPQSAHWALFHFQKMCLHICRPIRISHNGWNSAEARQVAPQWYRCNIPTLFSPSVRQLLHLQTRIWRGPLNFEKSDNRLRWHEISTQHH